MTLSSPCLAAFHRIGRLFFLASVFTFAITLASVSAQRRVAQRPAAQGVLPLDPLTTQEKEKAARIAADDSRVKDLLGSGRQRLIYVEFFALKPEERSRVEERRDRPINIGRHAEVVLFNPQSERGALVIVNLERGSVVETVRLDSDAVPLNHDDIEEARLIALGSSEVRSLLGRDADRFQVLRRTRVTRGDEQLMAVEGLRYRPGNPNDPCYKQRCVALLFRRGRAYVREASVIVNLSARTARVERRRR